MVRPRRLTRIHLPKNDGPSNHPDRIKVDTVEAIKMAIPIKYGEYREQITLIVHKISKSTEKDPYKRLEEYVDAIEAIPKLAATHQAELIAARKVLQEVVGRAWETSGASITRNELLSIMFFNL